MPTLSEIPRGRRKIREGERGLYLKAYDRRFEPHPLDNTRFSAGDKPVSRHLKDKEGLQVGKSEETGQGEYLETWYTKMVCGRIRENLEVVNSAVNDDIRELLLKQDLKNPYRSVDRTVSIAEFHGLLPLQKDNANYWKRLRLPFTSREVQGDLLIGAYEAAKSNQHRKIHFERDWGFLHIVPYEEKVQFWERPAREPQIRFKIIGDIVEGSPFSLHNIEETFASMFNAEDSFIEVLGRGFLNGEEKGESTVKDPSNRPVGHAKLLSGAENLSKSAS